MATNVLANGFKKSEGKLAIVGVVVGLIPFVDQWVLPMLTDYQSQAKSPWAGLGLSIVIAAYVWGRSYVTGKAIETSTPPMGGQIVSEPSPTTTLTTPPK